MQQLRKQLTQISILSLLMLYAVLGALWTSLIAPFSSTQNLILSGVFFAVLLFIGYLIVQRLMSAKQAEEQAYDSLRALTQFLPDRVVVLDKEGRFIDVLNRLHDTRVNQIDNVIGKTVHELYRKEFADFVTKTITETVAKEAPRIIEYNTFSKSGDIIYYEGRVIPYIDSKTEQWLIIWSSRDVTERIIAEKTRLDLALERNKVQFLHEFVSNMTHDFKTPLAIISTNAYIIGKTSDTTQRTTRLQRIQAEVKKLTRMVDDMLESARLESTTPASFEPTALQPMLKEIVHEMQAEAEQKSQNLIAELALPAEYTVQAIPRELNRAITNLVENAIKYTPDGGEVMLRLFAEESAAIVEVEDTGIGIDTADFDNIFTRFYRTDSGRFHTSGSGLGLAIVKMIIDRHGGDIEVDSELEKGSTFRVRLPLIVDETNSIANTIEM